MNPKTTHKIIQHIKSLWNINPKCEITLEANPNTIEQKKFKDFKKAGINRLSIGVQSFQDKHLKFLGRNHSSKEALQAIQTAQKIFKNISIDLIYALPNQSLKDWKKDLQKALELKISHLSLYQLTIERNTPFYKMLKNKKFTPANEKDSSLFYETTQEIMTKAGLPAYEISNHTKKDYESIHNLNYWLGGEYLGIGPGAHGRIKEKGKWIATVQHKSPPRWFKEIKEKGSGMSEEEKLTNTQRAEEIFMMNLRLTKGINIENFQATSGVALNKLLNPPKLKTLIQEGYLTQTNQTLKATPKGRLLLNKIIEELLT